MNGRVILMLAIGLGLMVAMWAKEWIHQEDLTEEATPDRSCVATGKCPKTDPICFSHARVPKGICTSTCARDEECEYRWCCKPAPGAAANAADQCMPPEFCRH